MQPLRPTCFAYLLPLSYLLLLCGLPLPLLARAQAAAQTTGDALAQDARLKQTVAVHAEGIPISDLLALLSRKTGVSLKADAYVADDKVIAFSPARPLRDTLADLSALFNDEWQAMKAEDGQPRYFLTRRLKARHYEDDLEQEIVTRMMVELDAQVKALGETPEELKKRPAGDHIRENLEDPHLHGRMATRLYSELSREQRNALFTNGFVNVSFSASSPSQQNMARDAFAEVVTTLKALDEKQRAEFPNVHIVIDTPDLLEQHGMRFRLTRTNNAGLSAQVVQVILGQNAFMTMGAFGSDSQWLLPAHGNPYSRKSAVKLENLPRLEAIRKAQAVATWIDRLAALSEAADVPVLADYYRSPALVHDLTPDDPMAPNAPLSACDALCKPSGYLWWTTPGKTLLLRKRDWYAQRHYEVPDRWLRDVQQRLRKQKNAPTYADLCRLLDLTPAQICGMNGALESNASGEMVNLDKQEGLHELLTLVQASADGSVSLPLGEPGENEKLQNRLPPGQPTPPQATLMSAFLTAMRQPITPKTLMGFSAQVFCYTPDMLKAAQSPTPPNVQVNILWNIAGGNPTLNASGQRWGLWLPLQIPDDRSDKTQVEVQKE